MARLLEHDIVLPGEWVALRPLVRAGARVPLPFEAAGGLDPMIMAVKSPVRNTYTVAPQFLNNARIIMSHKGYNAHKG